MLKRFILSIMVLLVILGIIFGIKGIEIARMMKKFSAMSAPVAYVSSAKAKLIDWTKTLPAVGTLTAINGVSVSSQTPGLITDIDFHSGQMVHQGQVLVRLDDLVEQKALASFRAQYHYDKIMYQRQRSLYSKHAAARSSLDDALSNMQQAKANMEKEKQLIAQKTIRAPFAGKLGIRQVNLGQYVQAGAPMVTLQSLNPMYVNFSMPEKNMRDLVLGQKVTIRVESRPAQIFIGKLTAINSKVDVATRSIALQATLANPQFQLVPGSYAKVRVYLNQHKKVVVIPDTALTYRLYGDSVYLVKHTGKKDKKGQAIITADLRYITPKDHVGKGQVIVSKGIQAGDEVVTTGQIKLQNHTHIAINNDR